MKYSNIIPLFAPVLIIAGLLCLPRPDLEPGFSYGNDWQSAPRHIQQTADKLELGLPVSRGELNEFERFIETIRKENP